MEGGQTAGSQISDIASDKLSGVCEISAYIAESHRRTQYLLETGQIPAGKQGRLWIASKARLRAHYDELTGAKISDAPTVQAA